MAAGKNAAPEPRKNYFPIQVNMTTETPIEYACPKPPTKPKSAPKRLSRSKKNTPLQLTPWKEKSLAKSTTKQAAVNREYDKNKRKKFDNSQVCESCGRNDRGISCSHLVPRSSCFDLISEMQNCEKQCFVCHEATESSRFFEIKHGLRLMNVLWNGLGESGRQRFWKAWHKWEQNRTLWQHSPFFDKEIHTQDAAANEIE